LTHKRLYAIVCAMDEQHFTVIARSFEVEGISVAGRLVLKVENGRTKLIEQHVARIDGEKLGADVEFAAVVKMLSALPKKSAACAA
jgi:hypothetical protein